LDRIEKIHQLGSGPQLWFFLDRKIQGNLNDYDKKIEENPEKVFGIYANEELDKTISEIFKNDLQSLIRSNRPQVRVLFGDNGTGKSTHLQYFKQILETNYQNVNFFFQIDLRHIAEKSEKGLWLAIFNQIYDTLHQRNDIINVIQDNDERDLRKIFKNTEIAKNIKIFGRDASEDYFYSENFQTISNIQAFFNGVIDILMDHKILTVIAIDEVQQIENWGDHAFEAFLESFILSTYDKYMNYSEGARLFFLLSFLLKRPASRNDKYAFLEKHSPGFVSRMKGKEILLCSFTEQEHDAALKLIAEITNLDPMEQSAFEAQTKSKLTYWTTRNNPREFGKYIYEIYNKLGFLKLTPPECRLIYESEARDFITKKLLDKGFTYVAEEPTNISGYNFDVYAEETERTILKKCAFGEIKTTQPKSLKAQVEKFSYWLNSICHSTKYNHPDNYYFFISPYDPSSPTSEILQQYDINWIKFQPPTLIFESGQEEEEKPKLSPEKPKIPPKKFKPSPKKPKKTPRKKRVKQKPMKPLFAVSETTPLKELSIKGLGEKRMELLEEQGIITLKNLKELDPNLLAQKISGITSKMLLEWKKECEILLNP